MRALIGMSARRGTGATRRPSLLGMGSAGRYAAAGQERFTQQCAPDRRDFPDRQRYAVAVFTRSTPDTTTDPARIDAGIGRIARALIHELRR